MIDTSDIGFKNRTVFWFCVNDSMGTNLQYELSSRMYYYLQKKFNVVNSRFCFAVKEPKDLAIFECTLRRFGKIGDIVLLPHNPEFVKAITQITLRNDMIPVVEYTKEDLSFDFYMPVDDRKDPEYGKRMFVVPWADKTPIKKKKSK